MTDVRERTPDCPNLHELFGSKYRVTWEQDGMTAHRESNPETKWRMRIVGKRGEVYPYGPNRLAVATGNPYVARKLGQKIKPGEECAVQFHVDNTQTVFDLIKPRRRKQVSEATKERLASQLSAARSNRRSRTHGNGARIDD